MITDWDGDAVVGTFYEPELIKINIDPDNITFTIDNIIKTRKRGKKKEYYVSWLHYPAKFNSWVGERDIANLK